MIWLANKKCIALTEDQYKTSVSLLRNGFELDGKQIKPNERLAAICVVQASLGLRLGDVLDLRLSSFIKEGTRYRLDIVEQKTGKQRTFTVPIEVFTFVQGYALSEGIRSGTKLFDVSERQVERLLCKVFTKMGLPVESYGSHSFRKFFATSIYLDNEMNIELVRVLLQHSSVAITQRYIGISSKMIENALTKTASYVV